MFNFIPQDEWRMQIKFNEKLDVLDIIIIENSIFNTDKIIFKLDLNKLHT